MPDPLNLKQTLLYSCTSAGLNIMGTTVSTWLLYFYAPPPGSGKPVYLAAGLVGLLLVVGRILDAVVDPLIGYWSDGLRCRWGRRRPFLALATPLAVGSMILLWLPPSRESGWINALYFLTVSMGFYGCISLVGIPYDASLVEVATTSSERIRLSMWKNIFGTGGVLLGALIAAPLFGAVGPVGMASVVGAIGCGSVGLTLSVMPKTEPTNPELTDPLWPSVVSTLQNQPFCRLAISTLLTQSAYAVLLADLPYFVTVVLGQPESQVGLMQALVIVTMIGSAPGWRWLCRHYAQERLLSVSLCGFGGVAILTAGVGLLPRIPLLIEASVLLMLLGSCLGGYLVVAYALMGTLVDQDEKRTGQRREALYYGTFSLAAGLGPAVAAVILPVLFSSFGYSSSDPWGVRLAFGVAGGLGLLGSGVAQRIQTVVSPPLSVKDGLS